MMFHRNKKKQTDISPDPCRVGDINGIRKLEDLKVLRRSPDLLNNVKIGQGQLQLIMEQILFLPYTFWSSDLNNLRTYATKYFPY